MKTNDNHHHPEVVELQKNELQKKEKDNHRKKTKYVDIPEPWIQLQKNESNKVVVVDEATFVQWSLDYWCETLKSQQSLQTPTVDKEFEKKEFNHHWKKKLVETCVLILAELSGVSIESLVCGLWYSCRCLARQDSSIFKNRKSLIKSELPWWYQLFLRCWMLGHKYVDDQIHPFSHWIRYWDVAAFKNFDTDVKVKSVLCSQFLAQEFLVIQDLGGWDGVYVRMLQFAATFSSIQPNFFLLSNSISLFST